MASNYPFSLLNLFLNETAQGPSTPELAVSNLKPGSIISLYLLVTTATNLTVEIEASPDGGATWGVVVFDSGNDFPSGQTSGEIVLSFLLPRCTHLRGNITAGTTLDVSMWIAY